MQKKKKKKIQGQLEHIVSFRPAWATQQDPVFQKTKNKKLEMLL
jgi:hypothetical protein